LLLFPEDDVEIGFNEDVRTFRKSLYWNVHRRISSRGSTSAETCFQMAWIYYANDVRAPTKELRHNNRLTKEEDVMPFDEYNPQKAWKLVVQHARVKYSEWANLISRLSKKSSRRSRFWGHVPNC
jgi:hypothetical protein